MVSNTSSEKSKTEILFKEYFGAMPLPFPCEKLPKSDCTRGRFIFIQTLTDLWRVMFCFVLFSIGESLLKFSYFHPFSKKYLFAATLP